MGLGRFSDTELILGVLAAFYVAEGIWLLRHGTVAFCRWLGKFRVLGYAPLAENAKGRLVLASPWPWGTLFLSDRWQFCLGPQGISSVSPINDSKLNGERPRFIPFASNLKITYEGHQLNVDGQTVAVVSCPLAARMAAEELKKINGLASGDRRHAIEDWIGHSLDTEATAIQFDSFRNATRSLKLAATVLFLYTFVGLPLLYYLAVEAWGRMTLYYVIGFFCFWYLTIVNYYLAHYTLYPTRVPDRRSRLGTMLLSPADAMRCTAILSRDLLVEFHPVAIAAVIFPQQQFIPFAGKVLRELKYPLPDADRERDQDALEIERAFRERLIQGIEQVADKVGVPVDKVRDAPHAFPDALTYCPRCLSQYVVDHGTCNHCPQMRLQSFQGNT